MPFRTDGAPIEHKIVLSQKTGYTYVLYGDPDATRFNDAKAALFGKALPVFLKEGWYVKNVWPMSHPSDDSVAYILLERAVG